MTVIKNEDWIEALNQTDYEPIETDENVYQSYRFVDLDINSVTIENYRELHQWLVGIGFPKARTQFESFRKDEADSFPTNNAVKGEATKTGVPTGVQAMFGDATLTIMTSQNNPVIEVRFSDLYPVALSGLAFNQQETDVTYLTATATFTYKLYEMFTI